MKIKNLLILTAAGLASSSVLANGSRMYSPAPMMTNDTGVYIEAMGGYNRYALSDAISGDWSNGTGNWVVGATLGYQFSRYLSAELGGLYTGDAKTTVAGSTYKLTPWYAYLAGKLSMSVYDNLSIFTKLGLGYQKLKADDGAPLGSESNWGAMFGAGLAYNFTPAFYIMGQWLRFTGEVKNGSVRTTAPNIFLAGLGYKFMM